MVLLLDLGNTNLYCGVYLEGKLVCDFRTHSDVNKSSDEYRHIIKDFLFAYSLKTSDFEGAILSCVVPTLTNVVKMAVERLLNVKCLVVSKNLKTMLPIRIDNPNELGSDLVCDSVGAKVRYGNGLIIVDLGTANKLLVIDKDGNFVGCVITPGLKISMKALSASAAQLMDTSLVAPSKIIGKNSSDSINSGIIYGTIKMIDGLCDDIEKEVGYKLKRIVTGGNSYLITDHIKDNYIYDNNLIFEGLYQIYLKNKGDLKYEK